MADPSYISKGVVAALSMVSGGTCYWPDPRCLVPVTVDVDGDMVLNVEIAHIRGAHPNGPRYVEDMTDEQRRQFGNLLLLCPSHHRVIDVIRHNDYSIEKLDGWKQTREAGNYDVLKLVPIVDEDRLQVVLTDAIRLQAQELEKQVSRFEQAITQLAAIDGEAASLLKQRIRAAETLHQAARMLIHTEDTSEALYDASRSLMHTEDTAVMLLEASRELRGLGDTTDALTNSASDLRQVCDLFTDIDDMLSEKIRQLRLLGDM